MENININELQGQRLKKIRQDLSLTQGEISDKIGLSQVMWCRYENGTVPISKRTLLFLQKEFNVNPRFINGTSDDMYIIENEDRTSLILKAITIYQQLQPAKKKAIDKIMTGLLDLSND